MKKLLFFSSLLFAATAFGATAPASLSVQGTALNESTTPMAMKLVGSTYELFTSLKSGDYTFSDGTVQGGTLEVEGENTPYCIRVNYDGETPAVSVKKVEKVILWAPWNEYTIGELSYTSNSTFKGTRFLADMSLWGDNRYRIRIIFSETDFETYGNVHDHVPGDETSQDYYDMHLTENGKWFDNDKKYKIATKYEGKYFDAEVKLPATGNYTHYITEHHIVSDLPLATKMQIEAESDGALENGTLALFKRKEEGVFEFVGGLKAGSFKIKGENEGKTHYYSLSDANELIAQDGEFTVTSTETRPYYIKVDLLQEVFKMQPITSCYLNYGSGTKDNRIHFTYDAQGRFTAQSPVTIPMAEWGRLDERYKFQMTLEDNSTISWGYSKPDAEDPNGAEYYRLHSVNNDKWAYSFKFMPDVWDKTLDFVLDFSPSGTYTHSYSLTMPGSGIAGNRQDTEVSVYPTIVENELTVKSLTPDFSATLFTASGTKVLETSTGGNELHINNLNTPAGVYFLKIVQAGNVLTTQRVIIK